jgi:hypothetical protein
MMGDDPVYIRALNAFHSAVHADYQAWKDNRDEPWPGWDNMSPQQRTELGIPEPPPPPAPRPLPPVRERQADQCRRYDYLQERLGKHLPWVKTQQVSMHWIRHTILTWVSGSSLRGRSCLRRT